MKRILLVNPSCTDPVFSKMKTVVLPPMGLGVLASRTPEGYDLSVVDENVETLDTRVDADLVAITATTAQAPRAPRAYGLLQEFRGRGIPTVMGGIHASVMPDEASSHADAVVIGEADELWCEVLRDFERGDLKRTYRANSFPGLANQPVLDRSVLSDKYVLQSVQTSRGCPCNCHFCSVTRFNGRKYRFRPIDEVVEEIVGLEDRRFFVSDDSIVGLGQEGIDHARRLFQAMKGLGKSWASQVCITIAEHEDLLRDASEAGARMFYIGFESTEADSLKSMNKSINLRPAVRDYKETIKRIQGHGIGVLGGFILGGDTDTKDTFGRLVDFVHDTGIDGCQFTIMTPFPGTRLYEQMRAEGRLLYTDYPGDWGRYNAYEPVVEPRNMTVDELMAGHRMVYEATSTMGKSLRRGFGTLLKTRSLANAATSFFWNYSSYKAIRDLGE